MKTVIACLSTLFLMFACQSGHRINSESVTSNPYAKFRNLGDALRGLGGVYVTGTGSTRKVTLSRNGAISQGPLFVFNGFPLGTDYQRANHLVNMQEVKSIRVVRSASQSALYGTQAHGGVIIIESDKAAEISRDAAKPSVLQVGRKTS